ncbi:hypothetical protein HN51_062074 [Arachis hypogaea]|uniref:Phytosulfokine n=1 Tax=Arachis hypogaea TaxID=3818 RepID=A0A445AR57_ARAHY|nr:hypothetical protein Ahy_B01g053150 [Arachis hypogaea]
MRKVTALFFIITLFLCFSMLTHAARPQPSFQHVQSFPKTHHLGGDEGADDVSCEGIGEDECLTRRTLAAHTDYIYTQKNNP